MLEGRIKPKPTLCREICGHPDIGDEEDVFKDPHVKAKPQVFAGGRARPKTYLRLKYVVDGLIRQMPDLLEQFGMILLQPAYVGGTKWTQADTGSTDAAYCR